MIYDTYISLGIHTVSILFNEIPIPKTPFQISVENNEPRGRSIYSKHDLFLLAQHQQQRLSSTIKSALSKLNENLPQKDSLSSKSQEEHQPNLEYIPFTEPEIQQFQLIKERFERKQPIDVVFGKKIRVSDGLYMRVELFYRVIHKELQSENRYF